MHVVNECGAWERHGLDVDYDKGINRDEAHILVPTGEVEFVSGNHVSTYAAQARGDTWAYLGQTVSKNNISLVTRPDIGIETLEDVRKRKFGSRGRHRETVIESTPEPSSFGKRCNWSVIAFSSRPDRWAVTGVVVCLVGAAVILWGPRSV